MIVSVFIAQRQRRARSGVPYTADLLVGWEEWGLCIDLLVGWGHIGVG